MGGRLVFQSRFGHLALHDFGQIPYFSELQIPLCKVVLLLVCMGVERDHCVKILTSYEATFLIALSLGG